MERVLTESSLGRLIGRYIPLQKMLEGVAWTGIGNTVSAFFIFASGLVLARMLGAHKFGQFSLLQSTLSVFVLLAGPSFGFLATKYVAEHKRVNPVRAAAILRLSSISALVLSSVIALLMFLSSAYIAELVFKAPDLKVELWLCSAILLLSGVNGAQLGAMAGFEAFREIAIVNSFKGVFTFAGLSFGAHFFEVRGAIFGLGTVGIVVCFLSSFYLYRLEIAHKLPKPTNREMLKEIELLFSFSLPNWMYSVLTAAVNWISYILVSRGPNGFSEMGIFNAANQFFLVLNFIPTILWQVSLPMLSETAGDGNKTKLLNAYRALSAANAGVILILIIVLVPFRTFFMSSLGEGFSGGGAVLALSLVMTLFYAVANVAWQVLMVINRLWLGFLLGGVYSIVYLSFFVFWSTGDAFGLAVARLVAYSFFAVLGIALVEYLLADNLPRKFKTYVC